MKLPYVIDNQTHVLVDILKGLLTEHKGRSGVSRGSGLSLCTIFQI
jgi:hypothetical protein